MSPLQSVAVTLGVILSVIALLKAGFAVAQFFITLAESVKSLTKAVEALAERFEEHAQVVNDDLAALRERVRDLERAA